MRRRACSILILLAAVCAEASLCAAQTVRTFCNPLDLDYGLRGSGAGTHRHGADPAIVLYRDRYYLFSTWDRPGYRVSDDLAHWTFIPFATGGMGTSADGTYTAAAVAVRDGWLYYTEFGTAKQPVGLYRTRDPDSGRWERVVDTLPPYADPCLFVDPPTNRLFMYHGIERPIRGVELDAQTLAEVPGTSRPLMPPPTTRPRMPDGWEVCTWDNNDQSPGMRGNKSWLPCREGAWMTFRAGTYYLQYASPGTTVPGYADGLLTGPSPLGPFTPSPHSPISRKDGGFITSAGHGCLFQDRHGNWWRAATMLIGVRDRFERRVGLFPAGFDADGVPFTRTELGDLPITLPDGPRDAAGTATVTAGWWNLAEGATATASSTLDAAHAPALACDEEIRTAWSARTGGADEWIELDLGREQTIRAVQVNLAEQDCATTRPATPDENRFALLGSIDGKAWTTIVPERNANDHAYVAFDAPVPVRFLRLRNTHVAAGGRFSVSDLRAFGVADDLRAPDAVATLTVKRDPADRRKVELRWPPAPHATSYLIRYGAAPDKLYQHHVVRGRDGTAATLYSLNNDPPYTFRVDALNATGRTVGTGTETTP
jgi:hypothetical protein